MMDFIARVPRQLGVRKIKTRQVLPYTLLYRSNISMPLPLDMGLLRQGNVQITVLIGKQYTQDSSAMS